MSIAVARLQLTVDLIVDIRVDGNHHVCISYLICADHGAFLQVTELYTQFVITMLIIIIIIIINFLGRHSTGNQHKLKSVVKS